MGEIVAGCRPVEQTELRFERAVRVLCPRPKQRDD
jgi:hypothetical protein